MSINIYGEEYRKCQDGAKEYEESESGKYYKEKMCLKETGSTCPARDDTLKGHFKKIEPYISNSYEEVRDHKKKKLCILPKGHSGRCSCKANIFQKNPITKKIEGKIEQSIFCTPGADDYVIKNRDSRLHPISITNRQEKQIKNKKNKLKCAIPLKEQSTPFMLATAYLDWLVYICSISGISEHLDIKSGHYKMYESLLLTHKQYLTDYYTSNNRKVFDEKGKTICAILGRRLTVTDLADTSRDNRQDVRPTDIQMGHISSRCDECYTVYGKNIVMMSRRGNMIIGEHSFIEDAWLNEINDIRDFHKN
jgi:hypothetical protein